MNRLTSGSATLFALLLVGACHGDPTEDLRGGVVRLQAAPSTLNVTLGKPKTTQVSAVDEQGNPQSVAYTIKSVGAGLTVVRDSTFLTEFVNDTLLSVPPEAPTFQFIVTGTDLVVTNFVVSANGVDVTIPVFIGPDPTNIPVSTIVASGPNSTDPAVITAPAGFIFDANTTVTFDTGPAIILSVSADGTQLTILAPPGTTSKGIVAGMFAPSLPQALVSDSTDLALTVAAGGLTGTDSPTTAPDVTGKSAFFDATTFTGADLSFDGGLGGQYYKFTITTPGDYTFTLNWNNDADLDMELCSDVTCSDGGQFLGTGVDQPETATVTLAAGTYFFDAVLFDVGASATNPTVLSLQIDPAPQ